ncbi:hypothetical protein GQ55_8G037800 [Panicum hallii var. hallii]|uniref:Bifunctional inhibitor/plant lipid transfer protein/seed storage helical domain-containing protein n=1 Tax=Panicum hallii var. hallii TaxID=1504633 RepID=A0A2T7CKH4_9POAL|nr:hypothetical protein GQ55_8G037800 [Panicum hallii var. hallii]
MATKVTLGLLASALVFTMFAAHQAWGEPDCYAEKELVLRKCRFTIKIPGDYVRPNPSCRVAVDHADMACICHILTIEEESTVSISKILRLARDCDQPVLLFQRRYRHRHEEELISA